MPLGASFFEDVPFVEFIYLVFPRMPGGVTVDDSGLCCCVPCLSSAIISLCVLFLSALIMYAPKLARCFILFHSKAFFLKLVCVLSTVHARWVPAGFPSRVAWV